MSEICVIYEYSTGQEGLRYFSSLVEAVEWVNNEGDHLIEYTIHSLPFQETLKVE